MKKILLSLSALAALTGSAYAADLPVAYKAPPAPVPVANWTGFYVFGGAGGGIWDANNNVVTGVPLTPGIPVSLNTKTGGDGYFGTVGAGYDWQFNGSWVAGIFGDGQFGSLKGNISDPFFGVGVSPIPGVIGDIKEQDAWAAGIRVGYLVAPNVLSYVNGGYTGSHWSGTELFSSLTGFQPGFHTDGFNVNGGFIGGGVENNLNIFGITAPGWFMKTEYRASYYQSKNVAEKFDGTNALDGLTINFKPFTQTIETSIVYRFNWSGPVVAKY
jgi:outer membrane immunogenic protein